jgi:hypothetical protein
MFGSLSRDVQLIVDEVVELCYFMRGAINYEEMMYRSPGERQRISSFIEKRLDTQKGKMNPVY